MSPNYEGKSIPELVALAKEQTAIVNAALDKLATDPFAEAEASAIEAALLKLDFMMTEVWYIQCPDVFDGDDAPDID